MKRPAKRSRKDVSHREFSVVIEKDAEGWYVGSVPALSGCHTQARSLDILKQRIREAIAVCVNSE